MIASHDRSLRRTARRHSLCADDAEDAYQRAVEILLTKAPECEPGRLVAWMHTVTRHEATALRRARERLLGGHLRPDGEPYEPDGLPSERPEPEEHAERRERVVRSSEALAALKPQERRALTLKAQGYSYAEIRALTGWTYTKVNRCMAEGRKRFLELFAAIEDGTRCEELEGALRRLVERSGEAAATEQLRHHLRACPRCRSRARRRNARAAAQSPTSKSPVRAKGPPRVGR